MAVSKKLIVLIVASTLLVLCFAGCLENVDQVPDDEVGKNDDIGPASNNNIVEGNNMFAFELYSELLKENHGNIFISPWSIETALAMAYEGARGETAKEMRNVLHLPEDNNTRWDDFRTIQMQINDPNNKYQLNTANAFWGQDNYPFKDEYLIILENYYLSEANYVNFYKDPEGSRVIINDWVEERTNEKIKDLIPPNVIDSTTMLVLTNAIYFKANWTYQFDTKSTTDEPFALADGGHVNVPMMRIADDTIKWNYTETDDYQALEFPYEGNDLSMMVILPKDNDMSGLQSSLDAQMFTQIRSDLSPTNVHLYLPRFKIEAKYFLKEENYLPNMGMVKAFAGADFSGITDKEAIFISNVIHQSFMEVNEEGTEAAAATAVIFKNGSASEPPVEVFRADHPFIFVIKQKDSGNILFLGKVEDPRSTI